MATTFQFFDLPESMAMEKEEILGVLRRHAPLYTEFFRYAQRSPLRNPDRRKTTPRLTADKKLEDFVVYSMLFLILSLALLEDASQIKEVLVPVVQSNYGTSTHSIQEEEAGDLLGSLMKVSNEPIILSFKNKMRKHRDGLLRTWQFKDVIGLYRRHLTPRFYEKKNLGQVFTPFPLIDKILDQIPDYIMKNPNSKFLDPSAGMGGFLVAIYHRLMTSLVAAIPHEKKRHDHIVNNMLYAVEITKNNAQMMKKIFGDDLHVHHGDALKMDIQKAFGVDRFDVVVGNPPFEKPQKKEVAKQGGHNLWTEFVRLSLTKWLRQGGYFGMVLPPGWRKAMDEKSRSTGLWEMMTVSTTPKWIEMYNMEESKNWFQGNVNIRIDLIVSENKVNPDEKTMVRDVHGNISSYNLRRWPFLPNANLKKYWKKIITMKEEEAIGVLNSSFYHSTRTDRVSRTQHNGFRHKVIHAIHADGGKVFLYANEKNEKGGFGIPKVIFNGYGGWNKPILDARGQYGMSEVVFGIPISSVEEGREIVDFFQKGALERFQTDMTWATSRPKIFWNLFHNIKKGFQRVPLP